jgi:HlyD family secretion protein
VLRVIQESEGPVAAGAPLLEIGDPRSLEVVVDALTSDAVEIRPGALVTIERWDAGSDAILKGHVNRVEPAAFTKISALGVDEQRVNVIIGLDGPPQLWAALGDGFRVESRISVWQGDEVLQVPAGAVFRHDDGWAVFVVQRERARTRAIDIGRRNPAAVQVARGVNPGEQVVVYPSDNVVDGVRVEVQ